MQVITFKAKPRVIFGITLAAIGVAIMLTTFVSHHNGKAQAASATPISCATEQERTAYLQSLGWESDSAEEKEITIPSVFNQVYENYNAVQKEQGFDLEPYKGKAATIYTYHISNYKDNKNVIADLLVADGVLIGADLCDPSAKDGFLVALKQNDTAG